jgi:hypothetical protein
MDRIYRLRTIKSLSVHHELENDEIHFSDLGELNDPMEGFFDYFWKGDDILWENFFKNYILCLDHVITLAHLITDKDPQLCDSDILVFKYIDDLPTEIYKERIRKIWKRFFSTKVVQKYIRYLSSPWKTIYKAELLDCIISLHFFIFKTILEENKRLGIDTYKWLSEIQPLSNESVEALSKASKKMPRKTFNRISELKVNGYKQMSLILQYNHKDKSGKNDFIFHQFPFSFVEKISELVYPKSYVSCFMAECSNPSLWSYYADNHKGYCLVFRTVHPCSLFLSKSGGTYHPYPLQKVFYTNKYPKIDFFKSLGNLPITKLYNHWYKSDDRKSKHALEFKDHNDHMKWYKKHWGIHSKCLTSKLKDWKNEKEYRIVYTDILNSLLNSGKKGITLKYKFEDLEGIIFGARMEDENKLKIMGIIDQKCSDCDRTDFSFYQAEVSGEGKVHINKLDLIKYKQIKEPSHAHP